VIKVLSRLLDLPRLCNSQAANSLCSHQYHLWRGVYTPIALQVSSAQDKAGNNIGTDGYGLSDLMKTCTGFFRQRL